MDINSRVKEIRKHLDLTMEEFGRKIHLTKSGVSSIEHNRANLSERTINNICREYKVNYSWLTEGVGEMFVSNDDEDAILEALAEEYNLTELQMKIVRGYIHLNERQRQIISELVMEMVRENEKSE